MRTGAVLTIAGVVTSLAAMVVAIVYFFQPWRTCDYEDTSVGCSMLPADAAVMMAALLALPIGVALAIAGVVVLLRRGRARQLHATA
ncbi:hypothetical protein GCM10009846_01800 [Agrococcus versicolor]|uniref:Uncharacterized protein n=1 Tax=Agrococcus versicolor TaxID=501482 RepID=A0ABN3AIY1_9MICO